MTTRPDRCGLIVLRDGVRVDGQHSSSVRADEVNDYPTAARSEICVWLPEGRTAKRAAGDRSMFLLDRRPLRPCSPMVGTFTAEKPC